MDLEKAIQAIMATKRTETDLPSAEDLLSFRTGALAPEELEELLERAAASPEVADALVDSRRFPDVEPADERLLMTATEIDRQWQRFHRRVREEGSAPLPDASAGDRPQQPEPATPPGGHWLGELLGSLGFARATAAASLAMSCGLAWMLLARGPVSDHRPRLNLPIVELTPDDDAGERAGATTTRLPPGSDGLVLVLTSGHRRPYDAYEIGIRDPAGREIWNTRGLERNPEGFFSLELPSGFLSPGRYEITLAGLDGERRDPLAGYHLTLE